MRRRAWRLLCHMSPSLAARLHVLRIACQALSAKEFEASDHGEMRELPPEPGDTYVRRELTGERTLTLRWKQAK